MYVNSNEDPAICNAKLHELLCAEYTVISCLCIMTVLMNTYFKGLGSCIRYVMHAAFAGIYKNKTYVFAVFVLKFGALTSVFKWWTDRNFISQKWVAVLFCRYYVNPLAQEFPFKFLAHPVFKMWIIQEPKKVALWNNPLALGFPFKFLAHLVFKMWIIQEPKNVALWNNPLAPKFPFKF